MSSSAPTLGLAPSPEARTAAVEQAPGAFQSGVVSISIVTFNSARELPACAEGLRQQTCGPLELIVVDNGSTDDSIEVARALLPSAAIITNGTNLGFARAQNIGISHSCGEFFMPLNPDVRLAPRYLERLVAALRSDAQIGTTCGKLLLDDSGAGASQRLIDSTGLFLNRARRQYLRGHGEPDRGQYERSTEVFGACGAAPLFRRSMLEDVRVDGEYFDTDFFMHKEDVDLAWRARLFGWKAIYEPGAAALHRRSFRPGVRSPVGDELKAHAIKNRYLTIVKNEQLSNLLRDWPWMFGYDLGILAYLLVRERSSLAGIVALLRLLPDALRKRRTIMRRARVRGRDLRPLMR
jgi:GT2 family glycosyltransferase